MNDKEVSQLLYFLLLDIRELARDSDPRILKLVDAFHTLPLELRRLSCGEVTESEAKAFVEQRAELFGLQRWLEGHLQNNIKQS